MAINFTPIPDGAPADAQTFNAALAELDTAIGVHNYAATAPPTVDDDEADGYHAGSWWVDVNGGKVYLCVDPTEGAAVWIEPGAAGEASSAVIGLTVLTSTATSVSFSNISGGYEVLELLWLARVTAAYVPVRVVFNDDTGSSYEYRVKRYYYASGQYEASQTSPMAWMYCGMLTGTVGLPATYASGGRLRIPGYAGTDFYKAVHTHHQIYDSSSITTRRGGQSGRWQDASAITKITVDCYGTTIQIGSRFLLVATG